VPFFKIERQLRANNVAIFSSNYPLYGDLSNRVMTTLEEFSSDIEVYSIDEMFLSLKDTYKDSAGFGEIIRERLWGHVRIPVSVGVAPTKTLAKLANRMAKKIPKTRGVCVLDEAYKWEWVTKRVSLTDIWGIADRTAKRLSTLGLKTAFDLANANPRAVRKRTNVCIERIVHELNGLPCLALDEFPQVKKQIYCTRSFGKKAKDLGSVKEAISLYATRAAEKLRAQNHFALTMHVFIHTSRFKDNFHSASTVVRLPYPTDDTAELIRASTGAVESLYKPGHEYLKAGVGLIELVDKKNTQLSLFHTGQGKRVDKLMSSIDKVNKLHGNGAVFFAAQGLRKPWAMRQNFTSPQYTSKWVDIPKAMC